ncbi:LppP/LprE family lipoprotein [Rhodococcoides fascians]|uniref:LppP/LprE family lipoprotein n=1 Tax=Rhodococcoides fascians TaxID=1828 RepID=UPI0009B81F04|nr:LppP/LprE family lipoprotein [Rhodococcus fascians]
MSDSVDRPDIDPGWYEDQIGGVLRYWDGHQWTDSTRPLPSSRSAKSRSRRTKWIAGAAVVALAVVGATSFVALTQSREDDDRWSKFPKTLACAPDQGLDVPGDVENTAATTVERVSLSHLGAQRLGVDIDFLDLVPPNPNLVTSPYSGEPVFAPGTLDYKIIVDTGIGSVMTVHTNDGWGATRADLLINRILDEPVPDQPSGRILTSFSSYGQTVHLEYDLEGQPEFFGDGPFAPDIRVNAERVTAITPDSPEGDRVYYASQLCSWDMPAQSTDPGAVVPQTTRPQPSTVPAPTTASTSGSCAVTESQALSAGLGQLPAEPITGRQWSTTPVASNFDSCADLSSILVTVEGATGSSPVQAMMFHRGEYLGTGTSEAYGFTDLDTGSSTEDTVVLTYKTGQTCNACNDGVVTPVRYQWDGQQVQMLDALPAQ